MSETADVVERHSPVPRVRAELRCVGCGEVLTAKSLIDSSVCGLVNGDRTQVEPPIEQWTDLMAEVERRGLSAIWYEVGIGVFFHRCHWGEAGKPFPPVEVIFDGKDPAVPEAGA